MSQTAPPVKHTANPSGPAQPVLTAARAARRAGDWSKAEALLRTVAGPDEPARLTELAQILKETARPAEAEAMFGRALAMDAHHVPARLGLGWLLRARGEEGQALEQFESAIRAAQTAQAAAPERTGPALQLANALRAARRDDEAALQLQDILEHEPEHPAALLGLGWIALGRQDFAAAYHQFSAALAAGTEDALARTGQIRALARLGRLDEAVAACKAWAADATPQPALRLELARMLHQAGRREAALVEYEAVITAGAAALTSRLAVAQILGELGRWAEAAGAFNALCESHPDSVEAWLGLGRMAQLCGNATQAEAALRRAAELAPLDLRPRQELRLMKPVMEAADWQVELEDALFVARQPAAPDMARLEAAKLFIEHGLTGRAKTLLAPMEPRLPMARQLSLAVRQIERLGLSLELEGAGPEPELEALRGYVEKPMPGAESLLLVFAGTNNRLWMNFTLLHRLLGKTGMSLVYVRDVERSWYTRGIAGLGADTAEATEGFRQMAARYGARRILTIGNCVGCLGALRYGMALGAEAVLGLGPKLSGEAGVPPTHVARLNDVRAQLPAHHHNIRQAYAAAASPPPLTLVYGADCADSAQARALAGRPGARRMELPGSADPDAVKELLLRGLLEPVLLEFAAGGMISDTLAARIAASEPA